MITKKIAKHKRITQRRLRQKKTLKAISEIKNSALQLVLNAFISAKHKDFNQQDKIAFERCETYRNKLLNDHSIISYEVFGLNDTAKVSDICAKAASKKTWCHFLYGIAKALDHPTILEIGTNLGISGSYLLEATKSKNGFFMTMEGLPQLCDIASQQFKTITATNNFQVVQGLYDDTFPKVIKQEHNYNLLFIDGNHKKEPTLNYFKSLKSHIKSPAIFVFDDIYWSKDMQDAWKLIKKDPAVNFTIDLYEQGIVIIDTAETIKNKHFSLHLSY